MEEGEAKIRQFEAHTLQYTVLDYLLHQNFYTMLVINTNQSVTDS